MIPPNLEGKRIVVTGAAGFIGSNLTDELLRRGAHVIGIDNLWNGRMENLRNAQQHPAFEFHKVDIRDLSFLIEAFQDVDIVFHEAAFTSVPQSVKIPDMCNDVNVNGVLNVLNAARIRDVDRVVFASSSAVYGDTPTLPKHELMHLDPISPYGVSKYAGEAYMISYYRTYGLKTTPLRYFNVFGPRQRDSPYSGVIAIFLGRITEGQSPLIFGDGEQSRDFTYVQDVIDANIVAATHPRAPGEVFNVAAGSPISMNALTREILRILGREDLEINYGPVRVGDIVHSYGDLTKVKEMLGFAPKYTPLTGLQTYIDWFHAHGEY
jgi:UDP-glucose 4-epimerase